jgi:hypothetical protein
MEKEKQWILREKEKIGSAWLLWNLFFVDVYLLVVPPDQNT